MSNCFNTIYNIEVDSFHTYHVGRLGVWVHNANSHHKKSGLSVGITNSLVDAANSAKALIEAGDNVNSNRSKAMAALGTLSKIHSIAQEAKRAGPWLL